MATDVAIISERPAASLLHRWLAISWRFTRQRPLGAAGAAVILAMIFAALSADLIAPYDPLKTDYAAMFQAPSAHHLFGTDAFGRDVFSRILYGSRTACWSAFSPPSSARP